MNINDLKRMALNAGASTLYVNGETKELYFDNETIARFARAITEECAKVCDASRDMYPLDDFDRDFNARIDASASAIRNLIPREQA